MSTRDGGDQGLRTVTAGHPEHVGPTSDCVLGELEQVRPGGQDHGLDTALPASFGRDANFSAFPPPDLRFMMSTGCVRSGCASGL